MLKKYGANQELKIIFLRVAVLCLIYGVGMEFVQKYFIPNRSFDIGDIIADAIGCLTGLVYSIRRYIKK
jgi:VanZ family protein